MAATRSVAMVRFIPASCSLENNEIIWRSKELFPFGGPFAEPSGLRGGLTLGEIGLRGVITWKSFGSKFAIRPGCERLLSARCFRDSGGPCGTGNSEF